MPYTWVAKPVAEIVGDGPSATTNAFTPAFARLLRVNWHTPSLSLSGAIYFRRGLGSTLGG
jgi:hypothetical protein